MSEIRNEPEFETNLELERLVLQCSKDGCEGAVYIMPETAQLLLDPSAPEYDHVHSMCTEPACEQRTIRFLDTMKSLDTIYDFQKDDVTLFNHQIGTYAKAIVSVYERLNPKVEVVLHELTFSEKNLLSFFAYLLDNEYEIYKAF